MVYKFAPVLLGFCKAVLLLDSDEETSLEIKKRIQVQEDVMCRVTRNCTTFLDLILELLQRLEVIDIITFSLDEFFDDLLSNRHALRNTVVKAGLWLRALQEQTSLLKNV